MPSARRRRPVAEDSDEEMPRDMQRRPREPQSDDENEEDDAEVEASDEMDVDGEGDQDQVVKKLVRYALACEYQRIPIKRAGITEKVMSKQRVPFKRVFDLAQKQLSVVFGMEMVELPERERVTVKDRRAAQKTRGISKSAASYILTTILPTDYRTSTIIPPSLVGSSSEEAAYVALCTVIVSIIQLNPGNSIPDHKLERYLQRMNAKENMPMDKTANVLSRMQKQGYIVRTVDKSGDDETIDWRVGPRGKMEIGNKGIKGLVNEVYGDAAPEDLQQRIHRSLGMEVENVNERDEEEEETPQRDREANRGSTKQRRSARGRASDDDNY